MPHPAPLSAPGAASVAHGGLVYLLKPASCGKSEALPLLFQSVFPIAPRAHPEHLVACSKSYALGRWRGTMGKSLSVSLADSVAWPSYSEGYDHGRAERREREAARLTTDRAPSWKR